MGLLDHSLLDHSLLDHSRSGHVVIGALLAHQGGWDEVLLVLGPIAVIVVLLMVARRRTRQEH
ncbi:MAG: hypothetical protein AB7V74_21395 [Acidimicrobiia bacterium]